MEFKGFLGGTEDGGIDAGGEGDTERVVSGNGDDARGGADEFVEVVGETGDDVIGGVFAEERFFQDAQAAGM